MLVIKKRKISSFRLILISFVTVIFLGAFLLMLPISSESGQWTGFLDALFTATSSACVTGLVVVDTATHWSYFGEAVLIVLIQIGGLGVLTVAMMAAVISGRKIGLFRRTALQESLGAHAVGGILKLALFIFRVTFTVEIIGALVMMPVFVSDFGLKGVWMSVFHSISAFCNAGFDLMGDMGEFSSLAYYSSDVLINCVIMFLIISGGIGFLTWDDMIEHKFRFKKYRLQSKVIIVTSLVLTVLPAVYFFFAEFGHMEIKERILSSLFQAVTPRTAGFGMCDMSLISPVGLTITVMLMLIGGSPGSTAGGMKTTTVAVLVFSMFSVFSKKEHTECFGRRIDDSIVRNGAAILLMYIFLFIISGLVISAVESVPLMHAFFETSSAVGTVGVSLGLTPSLSALSKVILMGLMFFGRVGPLTVIFAASTRINQNLSRYPAEKITVG